MKKINLLFFYHAGANCQYFETMLKLLEGRDDFSYQIVRPDGVNQINFEDYDVLVYQTFPDHTHKGKFNPVSIMNLDNSVLHRFKGFKILLDSFDMGDCNGFERFGKAWPRIKHVPSYRYMREFDVVSILCTTGWKQESLYEVPLEQIRDISIHCAFTVGVYPHKIREQIIYNLKSLLPYSCDFERVPATEYNQFLRRVLISVSSTGFGETSGNIYPALRAGALLFVYEAIKKVKPLPFVDLVDGEDYISFNLNNFYSKLDWIVSDDQERTKIMLSGQKKFIEGFNPKRSAREFLDYLRYKNENRYRDNEGNIIESALPLTVINEEDKS